MSKPFSWTHDYLTSGNRFTEAEAPQAFKFKVLNGFMAIVVVAATLFAVLGWMEINPIGSVQSTADFIYAFLTLLLIFILRRSRSYYRFVTCSLLFISLLTAISVLFFVPQDESRIIWFYLLVFVAYILGDVRTGIVFTVTAITLILVAGSLFDLNISVAGMFSNVLGLLILSLLTRLYQRKVEEYEQTLTRQKELLEAFNSALEVKVEQKTAELRELNTYLETKVQEKVDKVKAQEQMLIAQSRLAAMGEMLSMIAHQWRQPLATMTLMITNAKIQAMFGENEPKEMKMFDDISDTLLYLSDTIDDFQTYFEPQKKPEIVEIQTLLDRTGHFTKTRMRMNGVALFTTGNTHVTIETYGSEVVQILINLVNNAVDAIAETDPKVRHIMIACSEEEDAVRITVEDSGGGIPDDVLPKIFEPYFSTKSKNGTGLGLYMAKTIMENHIHGQIAVKNGESGAVFTILLPKELRKNGASL